MRFRPTALDHYLCECEESNLPWNPSADGFIRCRTCHKPAKFYLRYACIICDQPFIRDFKVPYVYWIINGVILTFDNYACWDCVGGEGEDFIPPRIQKRWQPGEVDAILSDLGLDF